MRVALVHDWLDTYRGGEKVLEALLELYPDAPVYTLFYDARYLPNAITSRTIIYPRWLQMFRPLRRVLLPFLPYIVESFDLSSYDLVISSSSCVAKGVIPAPQAHHLCYLHTPMRYVWDMKDVYWYSTKLAKIPFARLLSDFIAHRLRIWDFASSARVDRFVANSAFVAKRVKKYYRRGSTVIHPPIDVKRFKTGSAERRQYFLVAGALVPYKRVDLAIGACQKLGLDLVVAGSGPLERKLKRMGRTPQIKFVRQPDDEEFITLMQGARALIFPGIEDFGMVPVEAMACGTPVIAYAVGGAKDYVVPGFTGIFFHEQTEKSLMAVLEKFDDRLFVPHKIAQFARRFSKRRFQTSIREEINDLLREFI